jgi:hypothetical protein
LFLNIAQIVWIANRKLQEKVVQLAKRYGNKRPETILVEDFKRHMKYQRSVACKKGDFSVC